MAMLIQCTNDLLEYMNCILHQTQYHHMQNILLTDTNSNVNIKFNEPTSTSTLHTVCHRYEPHACSAMHIRY